MPYPERLSSCSHGVQLAPRALRLSRRSFQSVRGLFPPGVRDRWLFFQPFGRSLLGSERTLIRHELVLGNGLLFVRQLDAA